MLLVLGIQHARRMCRIILPSVACLTVPYFTTLSYTRQDFREGKMVNKKCVFLFHLQLSSEIFLILRRTERDAVINVQRSKRKVPTILVRF